MRLRIQLVLWFGQSRDKSLYLIFCNLTSEAAGDKVIYVALELGI